MKKSDQIIELQQKVAQLETTLSQQMYFVEQLSDEIADHGGKLEVIEELLDVEE